MAANDLESPHARERFNERLEQIHAYYKALPPDVFPSLTAHVDELIEADSDERFRFGLDMLIRSLETYVDEEIAMASGPHGGWPAAGRYRCSRAANGWVEPGPLHKPIRGPGPPCARPSLPRSSRSHGAAQRVSRRPPPPQPRNARSSR